MKKALAAFSLFASLGVSAGASAITVTFADSSGGGDHAIPTGAAPCPPGGATACTAASITYDLGSGLTLTVTGSGGSNGGGANLDWNTAPNEGGLGVGTDERINPDETLTLTFNQPVTLTNILFHRFHDGVLVLDEIVPTGGGTTYNFAGGIASNPYLASIDVAPVPEPSTWALLGVGLLGLGFMARRRAKTA